MQPCHRDCERCPYPDCILSDADLCEEDLRESERIDQMIASDPEVIQRAKQRKRYEANKAKYAERSKAYRARNKESIKAQKHAHYLANRERILARNRAYRARQKQEKAPDAAATAIERTNNKPSLL